MRTPSAYATLTAEIDEAVHSGHLSLPVIQYHEAIGLPYLGACCKEGMRLHPSVGLTLPRHVPQGGCMIAGEWFPEGARVGVNAAVVQRDKTIFGDDVNEFVPERWFRKDASRMERYMFQVSGHIPPAACIPLIVLTHSTVRRWCEILHWKKCEYIQLAIVLGRMLTSTQISLCEMYKVVPQLLRSFHLELSEPEKEWETRNYWFNKPTDVYTKLRCRGMASC